MKLGILTFHKAQNYGSALQAYALQTYLISRDITVELIDYIPKAQKSMYSNFRHVRKFTDLIYNISSSIDYYYLRRKKLKFEKFYDDWYILSNPVGYENISEKINFFNYDYICAGGDQIWNSHIEDYDPIFILIDLYGKKFSYAVSMGNVTKNDLLKDKEIYYNAWKDFKAISVRDINAKDIIFEITGKQTEVVLDSAFLLSKEEWDSLSGDKALLSGDYILFYSIEYYDDYIYVANKIFEYYRIPVFIIYTCKRSYKAMLKGFKRTSPCSPFEFINYIKNAKYVISSSFHGIVFSLIFQKQFWGIERCVNGIPVWENRLRTLLNSVGMENRLLNLSMDIREHIMRQEDINYKFVQQYLETRIKESKFFLDSVLQE